MTLDELKTLRKKLGIIKGQLTHLEKFLDTINDQTDIETLDLELRLKEKVLPLSEKFENIQNEIEMLTEAGSSEEAESMDERASFENRFYAACGKIKALIKGNLSAPSVVTPLASLQSSYDNENNDPIGKNNTFATTSSSNFSHTSNDTRIPNRVTEDIRSPIATTSSESQAPNMHQHLNLSRRVNHRKLPDLKIPIFSGNIETWLGFYDSFNSMIHNDDDLPTIQKFHYLKGSVTGDAANIIASLETTSENYTVAWELLKDRYHNKKVIIDTHVKSLYDLKSISREFSIRQLHDTVQKHLRALRALAIDVDQWNFMLIHLIKSKLNNYNIEKWEEFVCETDLPTLKNMLDFLQRRSYLEETRSATYQSNNQKTSQLKYNGNPKSRSLFAGAATSFNQNSQNNQFSEIYKKFTCHICKDEHGIFVCHKFLAMSTKDRYEAVRRASLCTNCLRGKHHPKDCLSSGCRKCGKRHNSLLHFDKRFPDSNSQNIQPVPSSQSTNNDQTNHSSKALNNSVASYQLIIPSEVVLATAIVDVIDDQGNMYACRVMLDSGSQPHVITEKCANKIGLKKMAVDIPLGAVDELSTTIKYTTSATIKSRYSDRRHNLSLFVVKSIGSTMPSVLIDRKSIPIPKGVFLADPEFHQPSEVDIILGAQYFYQFLCPGQISIANHEAVLQETELGWVVAGCFHQTRARQGRVYCNFTKFSDLPLLWEIESAREASPWSSEEEACELHYSKNTTRDSSGRYTVQLPFNEHKEKIGESRRTAFNRFLSLESKFSKNPDLKTQYSECIQGYIQAGHMNLITKNESSKTGFYLPHHAVIKSSSVTTKTRVVFDGSAKSSTGISLNDTLMVGPTIQADLFTTFTRFRTFLFALTADIEQMYRQIKLYDEHRLFHKIFWRNDPNDEIHEYALNTVTFGTSSAPFLAIRTLHQLAEDERSNFPIAADILKRDFYVDDLSTGAGTYEEALSIRNDLIALLRKGGFNLRKWRSNDTRLTNDIDSNSQSSHMSLDPTETIKTLGLCWNPASDKILYTVNMTHFENPITKRLIFSETAKLFDPLGLLGPVILLAKLLIQDLWKLKLSWDEEVPEHFQKRWINYRNQLPLLTQVQFNRCITAANTVRTEIHGFSDASVKAYGAALYLRCTDSEGKHRVSLICAKSRVAPLASIKRGSNFTPTIPKLELCAAHQLAKLLHSICQSMNLKIDSTFLWCDNTTVLAWINTESYKLQSFMANRVSEIQSLTNVLDWKYVPTDKNPADIISRGQTPREFLANDFWQNGPMWLLQEKGNWPEQQVLKDEIPGLKKNFANNFSFKLTISNWQLLEECSSFRKLNRVLAFVLRFIHNIRVKNNDSRIKGPLSRTELDVAHNVIIRQTQATAFSKDIAKILCDKFTDKTGDLSSLNPFLDEDGILRVGSRLTNANIPQSQKFPIILPRSHHITKLIIQDEHSKRMHAGIQATLYGVRQRYWPIDGKNVTRHLIRKCVRCFRVKPRGITYITGNLPEHRLLATRPFLNVGVDYCGPFFIKEKRVRNRSKVKVYVSVFVCFSSKAVHLEVVCDLTAEAFLGCLKRFISRRGKPDTIYSDNATNFVGANKQIQELYKFIRATEHDPEIQNFFLDQGINWRFIPPQSPHFGGLWEASVKSFKYHFLRTVGNTLLTYDQLETYVIEVEAILNSRPLTPLSSDPNDLIPLSPGHLLIGSPLTTYPQSDLRDTRSSRLSSWNHAQKMRQDFWARWSKEYMNELISQSKWQPRNPQEDVQVGTLVVLKEDNLPPLAWKLGRIVQIFPGQDKVVRVVLVKTQTGTYKRSVKNLYPLPTNPYETVIPNNQGDKGM